MQHRSFDIFHISLEGDKPDFFLARSHAEAFAATKLKDPMLIAWFDGINGNEHPHVPECQHQPSWIAYAKGHDGRVCIDVNKDEYSFVFTDAAA